VHGKSLMRRGGKEFLFSAAKGQAIVIPLGMLYGYEGLDVRGKGHQTRKKGHPGGKKGFVIEN